MRAESQTTYFAHMGPRGTHNFARHVIDREDLPSLRAEEYAPGPRQVKAGSRDLATHTVAVTRNVATCSCVPDMGNVTDPGAKLM